MIHTRSFAVSLLTVATLASPLVACGSGDEAPAPIAPSNEAQNPLAVDDELRALGVEDDEIVVEDGSEAELPTMDLPQSPVEGEDDDVNGNDADLEDYLTDGAEPGVDPAVPDLSTLNVMPLASSSSPPWWSARFGCAKSFGSQCLCRGSRNNCQFPNKQPGRNRYLPAQAVREILAAVQGKPKAEASKLKASLIDSLGRFELTGDTSLYDGAHILRGTIAGASKIKINFGQRKTFSGEKHVYAFAVSFADAKTGAVRGGGGWIPEDHVKGADIGRMPTTTTPSASDFAATKYRFKTAADYGCTVQTFDEAKCLPAYWSLKVRPNSRAKHERAGDYLVRADAINLLYQTPLLGGAATDTFLVENLRFQRARSKDREHATILRVRLYHRGGTVPVGHQNFVFGSIGARFGWVAAGALTRL